MACNGQNQNKILEFSFSYLHTIAEGKNLQTETIISVENLTKHYSNKKPVLKSINLQIKKGEIIALLGPNGAGKTTLISTICGLTNFSEGNVFVNGYDIIKDYRQARRCIGLVPQELNLTAFETVLQTVNFTRGLFGKERDPNYIDYLLEILTLKDKRYSPLLSLSGGMKRRVLIAKAMAHQPMILFLDEPSAGVDVELRKDMWGIVKELKEAGKTIILTTHYIEEAELMADRIGVIHKGKILVVEEKETLMRNLGKKKIKIKLKKQTKTLPEIFNQYQVELDSDQLVLTYDPKDADFNLGTFLKHFDSEHLAIVDLETSQKNLEEIFIEMVKD